MSENGKITLDGAVLETSDETSSQEFLQEELDATVKQVIKFPKDGDPLEKARLELKMANALLGLSRNIEAWNEAKNAFAVFIDTEQWS